MGSLLSFSVIVSALELGFIYALVALALFLSYSILNIADLINGRLLYVRVCSRCSGGVRDIRLALFAAMAAGVCSGYIMAFLQTKLGVESILAGIIVNTGLYTVNLAAMGFSSNLSLFKCDTIYSLTKGVLGTTLVQADRVGVDCSSRLHPAEMVPWHTAWPFHSGNRR